jgi:peptidylprolyl isomerase
MKRRCTAVFVTALATLTVVPLVARADEPTPATSPSVVPSPGPTGTPTRLKSGLEYIDDVVGKGPMPKKGQKVGIAYSAAIGNKRIESVTASAPFVFVLGSDQAMKGLQEGVSTMKLGGKRRILVPPELGYGKEEVGSVPPNSIIIYDVELLSIK